MRCRSILLAILIALASSSAVLAESGGTGIGSDGPPGTATNAFQALNKAFVRNYSALAEENQKATRPILITTGFTYELLCEDGTTKTAPPPNPVEGQLKAVSHVCAYIYSACEMHWRNPEGSAWTDAMSEAAKKLSSAISETDTVSWNSGAWPSQENKLRDFVRSSLTTAKDFADNCVAKGDVTKEQYADFAKAYLPTLSSTFCLASLSNAHDTIKLLKQWRTDVGEDGWRRLRVVIAAGKGRSTAGLTADTNPAAVTMASVMEPELAKKNILMSPAATDTPQALEGLALALTASKLADATFPGQESQKATWFYSALKHPDIPVALDPVRRALEDFKSGRGRDPITGIGH